MRTILIISFSLLVLSAYGQSQNGTYSLDLFSIISFGLAIASIIIAVFSIWLSWQFYIKSNTASDKTQEAVNRIESAVHGIKGDITEIVKRAVSYWVENNPSEHEVETKPDITEKLDGILHTLSADNDPKLKELERQFKELIDTQRLEIDRLHSSLLNAKVKNIFPSAGTQSAISVYQQIFESTPQKDVGQLLIRINRPVKIATATGKLSSSLSNIETLDYRLISSPYSDNSDIVITTGIGQFSDFHIHMKIIGNYLVEGEYVVDYKAISSSKE